MGEGRSGEVGRVHGSVAGSQRFRKLSSRDFEATLMLISGPCDRVACLRLLSNKYRKEGKELLGGQFARLARWTKHDPGTQREKSVTCKSRGWFAFVSEHVSASIYQRVLPCSHPPTNTSLPSSIFSPILLQRTGISSDSRPDQWLK
jgi:hypothetical protein